MIEPNFVAIGKIPGESLFDHKDDVLLLSDEENTSKVKCIAIDFRSRMTSVPVRIDYLLSVCPHDPVTDDDDGEEYDFEIDKANYRKFKKKALRIIDDRIFFNFKVAGVIDSNYTQGEIISM